MLSEIGPARPQRLHPVAQRPGLRVDPLGNLRHGHRDPHTRQPRHLRPGHGDLHPSAPGLAAHPAPVPGTGGRHRRRRAAAPGPVPGGPAPGHGAPADLLLRLGGDGDGGDAGAGPRRARRAAARSGSELLGPTGRPVRVAATVRPTAAGWSVRFPDPQPAYGLVVTGPARAVADTSTFTDGTGNGWALDGALQDALGAGGVALHRHLGVYARFAQPRCLRRCGSPGRPPARRAPGAHQRVGYRGRPGDRRRAR